MAKKAPFFSHDMNARHDPKISAMRGVYGPEGYGWFWMLIEMMAESDGYQLDCKSKYTFNAYAMQMQCKTEDVQKFITDCIVEFELFESDSMYFWSNSLRKRMQYRDAISEKKAAAANKRWEKPQNDADAMHMHNTCNADAMQNYANKTKQNETKQDLKDIVDATASKRFIKPTIQQVIEYCQGRNNTVDTNKWYDHYESNGWKVGKNGMKDWKAAVRTWEKTSTPIISESRTSIPKQPKEFVPEGDLLEWVKAANAHVRN